ncbi:MAG: hypothetical protein RL211_537 [Pseudomonadota bacterium]|jgi:hypothetical protein
MGLEFDGEHILRTYHHVVSIRVARGKLVRLHSSILSEI